MNRLYENDEKLKAAFEIKPEEDETATFRCRHENGEGPCPYASNVDVEGDGSISTGVRNALLQHAKAHNGGFRKMRRVPR